MSSKQQAKLEAQRGQAIHIRDLVRAGMSIEDVAAETQIHPALIPDLVAWADQHVEAPIQSSRQHEIAAINRQQSTLFNLWNELSTEEKTLETFKLFNREFIELSKARRALGGLDAPTRTEQKIDLVESHTENIDAEVSKLVAKLGLNHRAES